MVLFYPQITPITQIKIDWKEMAVDQIKTPPFPGAVGLLKSGSSA
jgi:hypothetical protein